MLSVPVLRRATRVPLRAACALRASARSQHTGPHEPFRILFCGSDQFSVASLEELYNADGERSKATGGELTADVWQSISVLTPPEQRIGRGGRQRYIRECPQQRSESSGDVIPETPMDFCRVPLPFEPASQRCLPPRRTRCARHGSQHARRRREHACAVPET